MKFEGICQLVRGIYVKIKNMEDTSKKIILRPQTDIHATNFSGDKIVHQLELEQVKTIIKNLKEEGKSYTPDKKNFKRVHNTITLSGSRGSGKTSFLYTLKADEDLKSDTEILDIIDPTLIEEKGHIFLNIIARIKALIDEKIDSNEINLQDKKYTDWNSTLKKLAAGLPMLDGVKGGIDPSDWNDTTFVMMDGLKRVAGANDLELFFHLYVSQSLFLLGKKFFFIAFDDVDTDFVKGWPVLETLRLTSPQIITFLSGDLDLYSFVVRKKQWKNFGKTLLKNEYDNGTNGSVIYADEYPELVEKLESQYLMKLLKPEYRVILSTLGAKLASKQIKIYVNEDEINSIYSSNIRSAWNVQGSNITLNYLNVFTNLPLRSQLSLLNALDKINRKKDNEGNEILLSTRLHEVSKGILDIFYSELRTANVDIWEMINGYGLTNIYLLNFLLDNKILDEASQFFPKLNNPFLDGAVVALGAILAERIAVNSYEMFDYIIRISNVVAKANWDYASNNNNIPNIKDFVAHSRSLFDYGLQKTACLQSAYILSFSNIPKNEGLIPIMNKQERGKKGRDENNLRIDEVFEGKNILTDSLGFLPSFSVQDMKGENSTFYSFYNILASIGDIIFQNPDEMQNEFMRMAQLREYPLFFNKNEKFDISEIIENDDETETEIASPTEEQMNEVKDFIDKIYNWKNEWLYEDENQNENQTIIPPYLLGRIMVRTAYSFARINIRSNMNVSELLHRQLIIFLNAVLVEEIMENEGNSQLRLTNPTDSDKVFIDNLKMNLENHPFFDFIFSCPLIQAYLKPEIFDDLGLESTKPKTNIYKELSKLNIKGITQRMNSSNNHENPVKRKPIQKINRFVQNTDYDANILIDYFISKGKSKELIWYEDIRNAIKIIFANSRVFEVTARPLLEKIKTSNKW